MNRDRIVGVAFTLIAAAFLWGAESLPPSLGKLPGAGFFPFWIGAAMLALAAPLLFRKGEPAAETPPEGWAREIATGGCVIDTRTNEVIAHGMSLPAAPRLHNGRLWLHESGSGWFGYVEPDKGRFHRVAFCPGFLRGLDFAGGLAFCAVSRRVAHRKYEAPPGSVGEFT